MLAIQAAGEAIIAPVRGAPLVGAIRLTQDMSPQIFTFRDVGPIVCEPWFAIGTAGCNVNGWEIIYRPKGLLGEL